MATELPRDAWRWIYTAEKMITDYQEGQAENKVQHNSDFTGIPRTGKNHTKKVIEEWGMAGDHLKTIFPHASKEGHLQETLQFMLPLGYFREKEARNELDVVKKNLEEGEYDNHRTAVGDLSGFEMMDLSEKIDALNQLIEEETNQSIRQRFRSAKEQYQELSDYIDMWADNILGDKSIPRTVRNSYREWDEEQSDYIYSLTRNFNMKVLTPISTSMPENTEYPDFFVPYAIPVDDFKKYDMEESLKIIFGGRNYDNYRRLYDRVVDVDDTKVTDLKAPNLEVGRPHVDTVSFADQEWEILSSESDPTQVLDRFKMAWTQMFNKKGIIANSDYEHDLRSKLKEFLLDDGVDSIVLYTGFLQNTGVKKLVMTHFMQTYESIIDGLSPSEERQIDRKFVVDFLEAQLVIQRRTEFNNLSKQDKEFNKFMSDFIEQSGHINTDVWADAKPNTVNDLIPANTEHSFITQIKQKDWEDLFRGLDNDLKKSCKNAFQNQDYTNFTRYGKGFVLLTEGRVTDWKKPTQLKHDKEFQGRPTYGYRHIAPRMTVMRPVPFSNDDPSFFTEEMGYKEAGRTFTFDEYVQDLLDQWSESDQKAIEKKDKEIEQRKKEQQEEEQEKRELIKESVISRLERLVEKRGVPDTWRPMLEEIKEGEDKEDASEVNFGIRTLEKWTQDVREELEDKQDMEPEESLDHDQVAEELKRDERFVLANQGKEDRKDRAVRYILENYDTSEQHAMDVGERASNKAIEDLRLDGVIDENFRPNIEGESMKEKKKNFRQLMGLNREEDEGSEPDALGDEGGEGEGKSESDPAGESLGIPGEPWECKCGRVNQGNQVSCPKCGTRYDEVDSE